MPERSAMRELASPIEHQAPSAHGGFFHASPLAFLVLTTDGRIGESNTAAQSLLGHVGILAGRRLSDLFVGADRPQVAALIGHAAAGIDGRFDGTLRAVGRVPAVPVTVTAASFPLDDETRIAVTIVDRSAEVEATRLIRSREEQYRTLFMRSPIALREEDFSQVGEWMAMLRASGVTDLRHHLETNPHELRRAIGLIRTRRVNAALVELLGAADAKDILQRGFSELELTADTLAVFQDQILALWKGETSYEAEFTGANLAGEPFRCRLHWTVQRNHGVPDLSRVIAAILDITVIHTAKEELRELVAEKDRFIATVSHELRTPLAAVFGLAQELDGRWHDFSEEEVRSFVELIANQSAFLSALVEDLLLVAKLEMGGIPVVLERVELRKIAGGAIEDVRRSDAPERSVELTGGALHAIADEARVRQILRNLLTNAAKYGGPDVSVEIHDGAWATVKVLDNGPGIAAEHRDAAFLPYERGDAPHSIGSLGLGLAISRELARAMGGDLNYHYEDGRSMFILTLPPVI